MTFRMSGRVLPKAVPLYRDFAPQDFVAEGEVYAVVVRLELYSTQVTQDGLNCTVIGCLVSWSTSSLAGLMKELIPAHLDLYFCDERHQVISLRTQERVKCSGFVH